MFPSSSHSTSTQFPHFSRDVQYSAKATPQQKVQCVILLVQAETVNTVQRKFRRQYDGEPPKTKTVSHWLKSFKKTSSVLKAISPGRQELLQMLLNRFV